MTMPWWTGGHNKELELTETSEGFELTVSKESEKISVIIPMVELVFLSDALGVIKDRWINQHMEEDYEFTDH